MDELITDRHTPASTPQEIIEQALVGLIPRANPAALTVVVIETLPHGDQNTWESDVPGLAEHLQLALHGRTPAVAESALTRNVNAVHNGDFGPLVYAVMGGIEQLHAAPWHPLRPGDLVHIAMEQIGDLAAWGETYVISEGTEAGQLWMRLLHQTPAIDPNLLSLAGYYTGCSDEPIYDAWFEAGPSRITVVRDGAVIPNVAAAQ